MLYQSDKNKYYRFPGYKNILDFERSHHIYFPSVDTPNYYDGLTEDSYDTYSSPVPTTYSENESSTYL